MSPELQSCLQKLMPGRMIRHVNEIHRLCISRAFRHGRIASLEDDGCRDDLVRLQTLLERGKELAVGQSLAIHEIRKVGGNLRPFQGKRGHPISVLRLVASRNARIRDRHPTRYAFHESTLFDSQLRNFWPCHSHPKTRLPASKGEKARRLIRERLLRY